MVDSGLRILVVGAGLAGLAVARTLRRAGFEPDAVERLPASAEAGAGLYLPGNVARALRTLGVHEAVRPLGALITRQRLHNARGQLLVEIDVTQLWGAVGECRGMPRADLHRVLLAGAGEVRHGVAVRALEIDDGTAKVELSDGGTGEYDLVVAADGRRSTVRALAGLGEQRPVGQIAYRTVISDGPELDAWTVLLGRGTSLLALPIGDGRVYCYADELPARGHVPSTPADPVARVREVFGGYGGPAPAILDRLEKMQADVLEEVAVPSWVRGPVVLIGDAAHAAAPNMAQGAAMALEDAVALAEELSRARTVEQALSGYEARRRPRTRWVLEQTHRRDRARYLPGPVRDVLLRWRGEAMFRGNHGPLLAPP
jgi:FAD-dependent urate hydroxylase